MTIDDAARCLPELAERVHASGESALLIKSGRPFVRMVPVENSAIVATDLIAFLRRWRVEHPEPDEQFAKAMADSRSVVRPPHDPWE